MNNQYSIKQIPPDAQLCYVKYGYAYFTTQPLDKQWGDDWNDAPYEHNAGDPYEPHNEKDGRTWQIFKLGYEADLQTPEDKAGGNSWYSVEQINGGAVAWLAGDEWSNHKVSISAGTTAQEFIQKVKEAGGKVYAEVNIPAN